MHLAEVNRTHLRLTCLALALAPAACADDAGSDPPADETTAGTGGPSATSTVGSATTSADGTADGSDTGMDTGDTGDDGPMPVDVVCDDLEAVDIPLAPLPEFAAVEGIVRGDGVALSFLPVDGARDYRVYELPTADAIVDGGGLHVQDATYRCAGDRPAIDLPYVQNGNLTVDVTLDGDVDGYGRTEAESTLGYVFRVDGPDRVPVYRLGSPEAGHDGQCFAGRTDTTRAARYTTDATQREAWLDAGWRDDGIVFYAPAVGDRGVHFRGDQGFGDTWRLYASDAELAARGEGQIEFEVLDAAVEDAVALRRFSISPCGGISHDVLSAGEAQFAKDFLSGEQPVWRLDWPSLSPDTILVVEALDAGCPFQGHLSPRSRPAIGNAQPFVTIDEVRAGAEYGELFINGQHDPASDPQPIARSFVCPQPAEPETWDVYEDFSSPLQLTEAGLQTNGGWQLNLENDDFVASFYSLEPDAYGVDSVLGELWVAYADWASDTNGKFRLTAKTNGSVAPDSFVHATVEVDLYSTGRRYPQLWVSSAPAPVQDNMTEGVTVNLQTLGGWPTSLQIQHCDHRFWDVNDQCPTFPTEHEDFSEAPWPAQPFVGKDYGSGVKNRLDLWVSTDRAYVFLDGVPHSCVDYPGLLPAGDVTVTYGDTLYHSGVDESVVDSPYMDFIRDYQLTETRRHVDNYAFSSGQPEPAWDHARLPCATTL